MAAKKGNSKPKKAASTKRKKMTSEELEVALSTQLFNDRVTLEGNFGGAGNSNSTTTNGSVVGDFNLEYRINQDGSLRAKVFNESNDYDLVNASSSPYTQGAGFFYRKEFDNWNLFKKSKKKKEKIGS